MDLSTFSPGDLTFPDNVDSTMLSAFDSCPQKFFIEFILKRSSVGKSVHLHAGAAVASAMEDIRNFFYRDGYDLETCYELAFRNYVRNWGDYEAPEKEYKDFTNCWGVVEAYFKEYPPDTDHFQPLMTDGKPAVEFKFSIPTNQPHPITGDPIMYSGRLDMLSDPGDGMIWAVDEKTTKALGPSWQYQWDMRGQFFGYTFAGKQYGYNMGGAVVRGMAIQQTQFGFAEKPIFYTNEQLAHWWEQVNRKIQRMVYMFLVAREQATLRDMHDVWDYAYGNACSEFGGCRMKDLCLHPEPWQLWKDFERREWNPLAKDPTEGSEDRLSQMGTQSFAEMMEGL